MILIDITSARPFYVNRYGHGFIPQITSLDLKELSMSHECLCLVQTWIQGEGSLGASALPFTKNIIFH
jgi:hypothetical protein